jgi:hypothetical protein
MSFDVDPADGSWSCIPKRAKSVAMPDIGDEMEDGTIDAGISPDTHKPFRQMARQPWRTIAWDEQWFHPRDAHTIQPDFSGASHCSVWRKK